MLLATTMMIIKSTLFPQAKLTQRKQRRLHEAARLMEEEAARRFVNDQTRQLSNGGGDATGADVGADLQVKPVVNYAQSSEEQALLREQERMKDDLKNKHQKVKNKPTKHRLTIPVLPGPAPPN